MISKGCDVRLRLSNSDQCVPLDREVISFNEPIQCQFSQIRDRKKEGGEDTRFIIYKLFGSGGYLCVFVWIDTASRGDYIEVFRMPFNHTEQ